MAVRSKVQMLPEEVRDELNRRLIEGGFSDYQGLADWLTEQGFEISPSSVHRYGSDFQRRLNALELATEQTKVIVDRLGDDAGAMGEAVTALVQQSAYEVLLKMLEEEEFGKVSLTSLGTMVAKLGSASVQQKKWASEVRDRARAAADEVDDITRAAGLSDEVAAQIRAKILGVV